jgi:hypothetical protein
MLSSHRFRPLLAAPFFAWITACTTPPQPPAPAPAPLVCERPAPDDAPAPSSATQAAGGMRGPAVTQVEGNVALLTYADRVRMMSIGELAAEVARLNEQPDATRSPYGDLQLAVALGQTRQPQDMSRAIGLLQRLAAGNSEEARRLQPMGRLIAARYVEQRRVEDLLDKQNQAMRDTQRRMDQLNERLEAVRAIERSLTRSNGSTAPAAGGRP